MSVFHISAVETCRTTYAIEADDVAEALRSYVESGGGREVSREVETCHRYDGPYCVQREGGLFPDTSRAAPAMLAALKLAEAVCEDAVYDARLEGESDNERAAQAAWDAVRAAIASAEGREVETAPVAVTHGA